MYQHVWRQSSSTQHKAAIPPGMENDRKRLRSCLQRATTFMQTSFICLCKRGMPREIAAHITMTVRGQLGPYGWPSSISAGLVGDYGYEEKAASMLKANGCTEDTQLVYPFDARIRQEKLWESPIPFKMVLYPSRLTQSDNPKIYALVTFLFSPVGSQCLVVCRLKLYDIQMVSTDATKVIQ